MKVVNKIDEPLKIICECGAGLFSSVKEYLAHRRRAKIHSKENVYWNKYNGLKTFKKMKG